MDLLKRTTAKHTRMNRWQFLAMALAVTVVFAIQPVMAQDTWEDAEFHDSHFHLTNYIQEGPKLKDYVEMMGTKIGRSAIFGLPLQQMWSYHNTGDFAPYYYLQTDAPLYYYSFTDAYIAMEYKSLAGTADAARSHDYGIQSRRYVCGRSYQTGLAHFSGRVHRPRRVLDS